MTSEPEVLQAARNLGQAKHDWAETYGFARMTATSAKDAEAAADEKHIKQIIELDALYQIALARLRNAIDR